jgi:GT2 family glycosyltransferase
LTGGKPGADSNAVSRNLAPAVNGSAAVTGWGPTRAVGSLRLQRCRRPQNEARPSGRVEIDGKFFAAGGRRFEFRGVTYGTFAPRADSALFPESEQIRRDFGAMREAGFSVVRTYTAPPDDLLEAAAECDLRVLAGVFYPDWRYLLGGSRSRQRQVARSARKQVREVARGLAGNEQVLGLALGNEVPADVLRWYGTPVVAETIRELVEIVREEDPEQLVTYANYPTAEFLPLESLDFVMFNVFLERRADFRKYLTRLHHLAGDRPLVLGELGISAGEGVDGELEQAKVLHWQLETAIERGVAGTCVFSWTDDWWVGGQRVEGWRFGLTEADRSPRPALHVASGWNRRTVRDVPFDWPSVSVVVCAHNASATLDECLTHTCALDYPAYEVVVVDDGSSDDTAEIAQRHAVRLLRIPASGLAVARNEGYSAARGELVAYLDADAYPSPEWLHYLALGLDRPNVAGVGGPNLPPTDDPLGAHVVARSPGGPVHVLTSDDRAEHVPGCNMAFWRPVLSEVAGFDPVYRAAGDDVDVCWKVLDRGWQIGFHPAAVVWHHRRPSMRAYLKQQYSYGRSEALVEARHPDRFTPAGTARWRGRIYNSLTPSPWQQRIYRGAYGAAAYQSVYHAGGHVLDLLHQAGIPVATLVLLTAPLALLSPLLALPAVLALALLVALAVVDMVQAQPPRRLARGRIRFRAKVALNHLLQPIVRCWGRARHRQFARRELENAHELPAPVRRVRGGVVVVLEDRPRSELAAALVAALRLRGMRATSPSGWEDYDARLWLSPFAYGELQTSSHPEGFVQIRIRFRPRRRVVAGAVAVAAAAFLISPLLAVVPVALLGGVAHAALRARQLPSRLLSVEGE